MSARQFVRYCQLQEMDRDIYNEVAFPHPYLLLWLECKRHANPFTGVAALPEPEKGYLDQDAELMLAFECLDEIQTGREVEQERRKQQQEEATSYFSSHPSS